MGVIKTEREIRLLKKAARISDSCIKIIKKSLKEDITERELARRLRRNINKKGATLSFQTLIASGKRATMFHPSPHVSDQKIEGIGYIDFGARYNGYCSDITVPFVKGKINKEQKRIVKTVLKSYNLAVRRVKIEKPCWELHKEIDNYLKKNGYSLKHCLGHGLGLKVHDRPIICVPGKKLHGKKLRRWLRVKKVTFQTNMVFTIEPGIYTKKYGIRIENDFILKKRGLEKITHSKLIKV